MRCYLAVSFLLLQVRLIFGEMTLVDVLDFSQAEMAALPGARIQKDKDGRMFARVEQAAPLAENRLASAVDGPFALAAVVRVENSPRIDRGVAQIASLRSATGDTAQLRVVNGRVQFVVKVDGETSTATSERPLPKGRWTLVAGVCRDGKIYSLVDGYPDAMLPLPSGAPRGPFTHFTLARDNDKSPWLGDIARVAIVCGNADIDTLAADLGFTAPAQTGTARLPQTPSITFPWQKALRVGDDVVHPIIDSGGSHIAVVPWSGRDSNDLISPGAHPLFGHRVGLLRPKGLDQQFVAQGLKYPLYDEGITLPFRDAKLQAVLRPDGMFDLVSFGGNTPFGPAFLNYYRNSGSIGEPKFETALRKGVGGKSLIGAIGETPNTIAIADVNGDRVPDLLLVAREPVRAMFPDGVSHFLDQIHPNAGRGKGYDVAGNWLGNRLRARVYWAPGQWGKHDELEFGKVSPVYFGDEDFQVQWHTDGMNVSAGGITLQDRPHLLLFGDVDNVRALPLEMRDGKLRATASLPLLADGARLQSTYFSASFAYADLDGDGVSEILLSGNPGRATVLQGDRPGNFREVGTLNRQGGFIEMDTLAVPCRVDWNADGFPDIIAGDASGLLWFWPGTKDPVIYGEPLLFRTGGKPIRHVAGPTGSIQGPSEAGWGYLNPTAGDWDGDGRPEIITNDIKGQLYLYRPEKPGSVDLQPPVPFTFEGKPLRSAWRSRPAILPPGSGIFGTSGLASLVFMDWDGDLAMAVPRAAGSTEIVRVEKLHDAQGKAMRFCAVGGGNWGRATFSVADWDEDGRWDILFGNVRMVQKNFLSGKDLPKDAAPIFLRNIGTNENPVFAAPKPIRKADGEFVVTGHHICAVWPTDLDGDGRLDLIMGSEDGKIYYVLRSELAPPEAAP
jgi:hypothetical protein